MEAVGNDQVVENNGATDNDRHDNFSESPSTSSTSNQDSFPIVIKRKFSRSRSTSFRESLGSISSIVQGGFNDVLYMRSIERTNISLLMKLVVKHLLETGMRKKRIVESHEVPLIHFFITLENLMSHGLKTKKNLLGVTSSSSIWPVLEVVQSLRPEAVEITKSVKDLPHVRTAAGKSRAWLRMAFMQKRLADYFVVLIDKKELLLEFYDEGAFMLGEEATAVGGLLIGLNVIECNEWCAKDDSLDQQMNVVDMRHYFKSSQSFCDEVGEEEHESPDIKEVLDQKNYLEELNRSLMNRIHLLKERIQHLENEKHDSSFEVLDSSSEVVVPSSPLNGFLRNSSPQEKKETIEEKLAKELDSAVHAKNEMEVAMKLLEKDIHEKQDTIVSIRRQLEDIKAINIQLFQKTKQFESDLKEKDGKILKQDQKIASCLKTISQLESKVKSMEEKKNALEETKSQYERQIQEIHCETTSVEAELKQERDWRLSLKKLVDDQQAEMTRLTSELEEAKQNLNEYHRLRKEFLVLQKKCSEYELSLEEVGIRLKDTTLEVDDLRESSVNLKEAVWMKDKDVSDCFQCEKPFSVARRKHHCRNCGRIFCGSCSDNKMPLASSDKPVRVCDSCHTILLERCSAKS